ncbi:MAG TPA: hypothetical protein PLB25_15900 [Rhodoferax sp.]|nr:hypothetical protein [Rhodoferax sp.]
MNAQKSAVDRPRNRKFLGFTVSRNGARIKVADKAIDKLRNTIRELTRRTRGHRLIDIVQELKTALTGWKYVHTTQRASTLASTSFARALVSLSA